MEQHMEAGFTLEKRILLKMFMKVNLFVFLVKPVLTVISAG